MQVEATGPEVRRRNGNGQVFTEFDPSITVDSVIRVDVEMFYGDVLSGIIFESRFEPINCRVLSVLYRERKFMELKCMLLQNHPLLTDATEDAIDFSGDIIYLDISTDEPFMYSYAISERVHYMLREIAQSMAKIRITRKRDLDFVFEDACIDPEIAARVCHSSPGIHLRNRFISR